MKSQLARLTQRELSVLAGVLLAAGYVNIGSVNVTHRELAFDLRGPLFWRLTSGLPPLLHNPGSTFYVQLEAYMALLLFTDHAQVSGLVVAASAIILRVQSPLFAWRRIRQKDWPRESWLTRVLLVLLNFAIGIQLVEERMPFVITAVSFPGLKEIRFVATANTVQRVERKLPSKFTIPQQTNAGIILHKLIGAMLTAQALSIVAVSMGRGGEISFTIGGRVFHFHKL